MKKILSTVISLIFLVSSYSYAEEKLSIEKQLVGIVGAISGTVKTETRELKAGDKIYLNETIYAGAGSGTQILLLDQSTFTVGEDSEVVMDTFVFDPATNDGKIVASVKQGSLKVISGLISKKNPDSLTVEVPEGTLGSRGTEFQTIVSNGRTDTLLVGPGKNNTLGMRPGAVLVGNKFGSTLLDNPYSMTSMTKGKKITKNQLKKFNKKMKALRVAKLSPDSTKQERKELRKSLKKELKAMGFEKEEIKSIIKENIKKDKEKKVAIKKDRAEKKKKAKAEKKKAKKKKAKATEKKKGKKKKAKAKNKKGKKKKAKAEKKKGKKKKAVKKKATKKKAVKKKASKKKKAVKKKPAKKKKKAVKKKSKKKKKVKKKPKKKKKVVKKKRVVKKKKAAKKRKAKKKRRKKK